MIWSELSFSEGTYAVQNVSKRWLIRIWYSHISLQASFCTQGTLNIRSESVKFKTLINDISHQTFWTQTSNLSTILWLVYWVMHYNERKIDPIKHIHVDHRQIWNQTSHMFWPQIKIYQIILIRGKNNFLSLSSWM